MPIFLQLLLGDDISNLDYHGHVDSRTASEHIVKCYFSTIQTSRFTPPETDIRLIHRANERISADALVFALQRLYKIVTQFLTYDDFSLS